MATCPFTPTRDSLYYHYPRARQQVMASLSTSTLNSAGVDTIKERLLSWQYPPEHRLTEDGLCREFGVSRSPVREALRILATNGFVRRMDNRGYAVNQMKVRDLEELYDVRLALELFAGETLTEVGAPAGALMQLAEIWRTMQRNPTGDVDKLAYQDAQFHEALARLAGNALLLEQLQSINERLLVFRTIDFAKPDRVENTCAEYLALLDRIMVGDVAGARAALRLERG